MNPTRILEIGTAGGGTLLMFAAIADDDATLISIDLPQPEGYGRHRERIYRAFGRGRQQIDLIRADSHLHDTLDQVRLRLGDAPLDFLFIDGDHSGSGVRQDFEMYAPLVRRGGIIALHDIVPGPTELVGGVPEFWAELRGSLGNASEEIIEDRAQGGLGIGVIVAT